MQVQFKVTKDDYKEYFRYKRSKDSKASLLWLSITIVFITICFFQAKDWKDILIDCLILVGSIAVIIWWKRKIIKRSFSNINKELQATLKQDGIEIKNLGTQENRLIKWPALANVGSNDNVIFLTCTNKTELLIPKKFFLSQPDYIAFEKQLGDYFFPSKYQILLTKKNNPPYWMGFLCLIPLIGAFVGIAMIITGIAKYKNKWFVLIGVAGVIFTVIIYSSLFFLGDRIGGGKQGFVPLSKMGLNTVMKDVEFYKIKNGVYPDSLKQLDTKEDMVSIDDPIQIWGHNPKGIEYIYKKEGNKYYLFSVGVDGIAHTSDDIFPDMSPADTAKLGLILPKRATHN